MTLDVALSIVLAVTAVCYLLLGGRLIAGRREVGSAPIGALLIIIAIWVLGGAIELMATNFVIFSIGRSGHFVGTAIAPLAAYVCFREYIGQATPFSRIALLAILPVVSIVLAATNAFHELMWFLPAVDESGRYLTRPASWGPWFIYVHGPYSYVLIGAAILTLLLHGSSVARAHRRGLYLLVGACSVPLLATVAYDLGLGPDTISYVPFVFAVMLPIYAWLIIGEKIVELAPLAYETVFQHMQDPVVVIDDQHRVIGLNRCAEDLLEISETAALLKPLENVLRDDAPKVFEALRSGRPQKMLTSTGRYLHLQVSPLRGERPTVRDGRVLMFRDVSDVEQAQEEVRNNESLLRTLIDHSVNGIIRLRWVPDEDNGGRVLRCIFVNSVAARFLNTQAPDLTGRDADEMIRLAALGMPDNEIGRVLGRFHAAVANAEVLDIELQQRNTSGYRWLRLICQPVGKDFAATFIDVSDEKARERQMETIAWADPLTGVLNRRGFERDAAKRLSESDDHATGALLYIDLNDFKKVNDTFGHDVGDQLLKIAAERLTKSLRSCDIVGRPGGDEFVALVPDVSASVAERLAMRLADKLEQPYLLGTRELGCAASIGLALYPRNSSTLTGLLREADQAMYRAKDRCRGATDVKSGDLLERAV